MATTIYLVRHGATEGSGEKRYKGSIDVPLSSAGLAGAKETAKFIKKSLPDGVRAVYSSNLSRAINSARPIAESFGLDVTIEPGLRERHFGVWEGMSFSEIEQAYPNDFKGWVSNPLEFSPVGGESTIEVRDRVVPVLNRLIDRHRDETFVIVAHGGVNRSMLCYFMGLPLQNIFRIEQDFSCVNVIALYDQTPVVKLLNGGPCI